jgi:rRNA processing protein Gar1
VTLGTAATVERDDETGEWFVVTENECEWEPEHGLQIVLRNGEEVTRVSDVDGSIHE